MLNASKTQWLRLYTWTKQEVTWYYVKSLTGQWHHRVQTESQQLQLQLLAIVGFQFGLYHVIAPLSFLRSISLASLFAIPSIFGWSDLLQILRLQAAFSFAVLCIIMFYCLKARLHRRFLSRQLDAIFVAAKLLQVSNMFETPAISRRQIALKIAPGLHVRFWSCNLGATKIASICRDKNRLCKRALN